MPVPEPKEWWQAASSSLSARLRNTALYQRLVRLPILMVLFSFFLALGIVQLTLLNVSGLYQVVQWQRERAALQSEVATLQEDIHLLKEVRFRAEQPATLTELARCQGFVGESESIWVAVTPPASTQGNCETPDLP